MTIFPSKFIVLRASCTLLLMSGATLGFAQGVSPKVQSASPSGWVDSGQLSVSAQARHREFLHARMCVKHYRDVLVLASGVNTCSRQKDINAKPCARWTEELKKSSNSSPASMGCSGDPNILESGFRDAVEAAAKAGDEDARICYIKGAFLSPADVDIESYQNNARRYLKKSIMRGDWRGVGLLAADSPDHRASEIMDSIDIVGKPFTLYRANRLLELGSTGSLQKEYAGNARAAALRLTPAQVVNANVWAAQTYMKFFSKLPKLTSRPSACMSD